MWEEWQVVVLKQILGPDLDTNPSNLLRLEALNQWWQSWCFTSQLRQEPQTHEAQLKRSASQDIHMYYIIHHHLQVQKKNHRITSLCSNCKWRNWVILKIYSSYASNGNQDKCAQWKVQPWKSIEQIQENKRPTVIPKRGRDQKKARHKPQQG
jgi:hypothetical protein